MAEENKWTKEKIKSKIIDNELDLSLCSITRIPVKHLISFTKVTVLDLSCNKINIIPDNFTSLTHLVQLDLSKNSLSELPEDFGKLFKLKKLDLLNNNISNLPLSFGKLKNLVWLDLKGNPIQEFLPEVVGDCLKPVECQTCAKSVVEYYENLQFNKEQNELKKKRKEEERLAKQLKEEASLRQRKREERKNKQQKALKEEDLTVIKQVDKKIEDPKEHKANISSARFVWLISFIAFAIIVLLFLFKTDFCKVHVIQYVNRWSKVLVGSSKNII
ncbi:leucine-rich repeat 1 [Hydra vulgaris]|uniref:Leucine-rich repeat 1 n=1 Tax=Hydra vulgaris TaxID=6087 RepID=B3RFR6_HYDVU|nr:leucine-rich repeat 1 [Hydra vulgaris]ABE26985.1 leucine-rich repeat 1 [Hydra vulgaris]